MDLKNVLILMGIFCVLMSVAVSARTLDVNLVFYRQDSVYNMYVLVTENIKLDYLRIGKNYTLEVLDSTGELVTSTRGILVGYLQPGDNYTFEVLSPGREVILTQIIGIPPQDFDKRLNIMNIRFLYQEGMSIIRLLYNESEIYSMDLSRYASMESTTIPIMTTMLTTIPLTTSTTTTIQTTIPSTTSSTTTTIKVKVYNCGNLICESMENYKNCPKDCPSGSKDEYCDWMADEICDPDCYPWEDSDCESSTTTLVTMPTTITTTISTITPTTTTYIATTMLTTIPTTIPKTTSTTIIITSTIPTTTSNQTTTIKPDEKKEDYTYLIYAVGALTAIAVLLAITRKIKSKKKRLKKVDEEDSLRYWIEGKLRAGENPALLKRALEQQGSDPAIVDEIMQKMWQSSAEVI